MCRLGGVVTPAHRAAQSTWVAAQFGGMLQTICIVFVTHPKQTITMPIKPATEPDALLLQAEYKVFFETGAPMNMPVMPIPKDGPCPAGYYSNGNTCVLNANAKPVIVKNGNCPSGWHSEGNYCMANTSSPKMVIPKNGACPTGYHTQGSYCVQN